jgi:hypothetical protein
MTNPNIPHNHNQIVRSVRNTLMLQIDLAKLQKDLAKLQKDLAKLQKDLRLIYLDIGIYSLCNLIYLIDLHSSSAMFVLGLHRMSHSFTFFLSLFFFSLFNIGK